MPIDCNENYERVKNVEAEHGTDTSAVRKIKTRKKDRGSYGSGKIQFQS